MAAKHLLNKYYNYQSLLQSSKGRLKPLQQIHTHLIVSASHQSLYLLTKLVALYCTTGSIKHAHQLFLSIPDPDSFLFSTLINSSTKFHFPLHSIYFYHRMISSCAWPSSYAFTAVIKACAEVSDLEFGRVVHCHFLAFGYGFNVFVQASLVSFYAKCGELGVARKVFDGMPERTVVAWNSMISGYEQYGYANEAVGLFCRMRDLGVGFDSSTFVSVLSACSQLGDIDLGCWVYEYVRKHALNLNVVLGTAFINMYAKCGNVSKAREVFDLMKEHNVVSWTAIISGYGIHGYGKEAMELFEVMKSRGPPPNSVTFIAVLSACAHAGLVQEGREAFATMTRDHGLVPKMEHHVAMVDMLGRAGLLDEAFQHIKDLNCVRPAPAIWTAMLGACKMHKNMKLGVQVAEHLLDVEPEIPAHYVLLSNIYAMAGRTDRVEMIRNLMIRKGLKKQVGYSTVEIDQKTYLFKMGDKSHPETTAIYKFLDELMQRSRAAGYVPVCESVMHELEEEEREYALRYHSEKLAVAFGLLKTRQGMTITIVKNLRMCEDCHVALKFISVICSREIIVRDKLRFHHFKNGSCSCMDYW